MPDNGIVGTIPAPTPEAPPPLAPPLPELVHDCQYSPWPASGSTSDFFYVDVDAVETRGAGVFSATIAIEQPRTNPPEPLTDEEEEAVEAETRTCPECGSVDDNLMTLPLPPGSELREVCEECYDSLVFVCDRCDDDILADEPDEDPRHEIITGTGDDHPILSRWCRRCREFHSTCCEICDGYGDDTANREVDNANWCAHCVATREVSTCEQCNRLSTSTNTVVSDYDSWGQSECEFCDSCYEEHAMECEACEVVWATYRLVGGRCPQCVSRDIPTGTPGQACEAKIYDYHRGPRLMLFGDGSQLHMGVELELERESGGMNLSAAASHVYSIFGNQAYVMRDGSLNDGFEVVTHPHTFEEMVKLWNRWTPPRGYYSHGAGSCGLHVHLERKHLSALQVGKMLVFINAAENGEFIRTVAQRTSERWARRYPKKLTDGMDKNGRQEDRYEALNLISSRPTIEFRIFNGNLRKERILKAIEFCHAVQAWTKLASCKKLTVAEFTAYTADNRHTYPNLHGFLVEKGLTRPVSKPNKKQTTTITTQGDL